eukprot:s3968_g10.t1
MVWKYGQASALYTIQLFAYKPHLGKGWPFHWLLYGPLVDYVLSYHNSTIIREGPAPDPKGKYLFAMYPHGVYGVCRAFSGGVGCWRTLFPGISARWGSFGAAFFLPGIREMSLFSGCLDASKPILERAISRGENLMLLPGGIDEMNLTDGESKETQLVMTDRKGFVKISIENGLDIIPGWGLSFFLENPGWWIHHTFRLPHFIQSLLRPLRLSGTLSMKVHQLGGKKDQECQSRFESPESTAPVSSSQSAMSVKPIREHAGKALLEKLLPEISGGKHKMGHAGVLVTPSVLDSTSNGSWDKILEQNPWLKTTNLVAKPDQLIKRRGKAGLIAVNKTFDEAKQWVMDRMCKEQKVEHVTGQLTHFLVEPFVPHKQEQEHYICMLSHRYHDEILFYHEGGVDVGDVDAKAERLEIPTGEALTEAMVTQKLLTKLTAAKQGSMASFICSLYKFYTDLHFAYLEINPLVMLDDNTVVPLDMAAKLDETH